MFRQSKALTHQTSNRGHKAQRLNELLNWKLQLKVFNKSHGEMPVKFRGTSTHGNFGKERGQGLTTIRGSSFSNLQISHVQSWHFSQRCSHIESKMDGFISTNILHLPIYFLYFWCMNWYFGWMEVLEERNISLSFTPLGTMNIYR